jgi:hypothetical protein
LRDKELGGTPKCSPSGSVWFWFNTQLLQILRQLPAIVFDDGVDAGSKHRRDLPPQL